VNNGIIPSFEEEMTSDSRKDFFFRHREDPEEVLAFILELVNTHLSKQGFDRLKDIQVLTPMNKGILGVENLNKELQKLLNPSEDVVIRGSKNFRINDKVMQIRNNYDRGVFNGDIGTIGRIRPIDQEVDIIFDERAVTYDYSDLDEVVLAYAVSVHKSQGSEYPVVVIPVVSQHYILLQRNLIYTAITRGKNMVVMIGTKKALAIAVKNDKTQKRFTGLANKLY
jgi:exodeoxyribonuclease V alpha subunit